MQLMSVSSFEVAGMRVLEAFTIVHCGFICSLKLKFINLAESLSFENVASNIKSHTSHGKYF